MGTPPVVEVAVHVRRRSRVLAALVAVASLVGVGVGLAGPATPAQAASRWAPASSATIHPGVLTVTVDSACTANFVFFRGEEVYLGQAAHCASLGGASDIDGCRTPSRPLGTPVRIQGATRPGTLVYSSWVTMQQLREQDRYACAYNDFALVRIDPADRGRVNPSLPHWGGPTGIVRDSLPPLTAIYSVGNSPLRQGLELLAPKVGLSLGNDPSGWSHWGLTLTPGIPGDSGSALLDQYGRAVGVLSTLELAPVPATNDWGDMSHELQYARNHGMGNLLLALGTVPFNPNQLPLG
jgi:hypothetical protein